MTSTARIALVPPRFGPDVVGGAEAVLREIGEKLSARGHSVEVLTTCARNHFTWENELPSGVSDYHGITVRRFPIAPAADLTRKHELEAAIVAGQRLSLGEQQEWANAGMRVPDLFHHLLRSGEEYDTIVFAPYLFWTTYACATLFPRRTALMSCLHDEPFARLDIFAPMFEGSRDIWFLSDPERELAHDLFRLSGNNAVIGSGIEFSTPPDPEAFRSRHGITDPFVLYAGRREGAKGWENLLDQFDRICARIDIPFKFVTFGSGAVSPPEGIADRVVDLGFLPEAEKSAAFAAAAAYLQPSTLESFSRTILEAWLAGTVVIANGAGDVVRWHCERSGAGLTYSDEYELQACLEFVASNPTAATEMAKRGTEYVSANYGWGSALECIESRISEMAQ